MSEKNTDIPKIDGNLSQKDIIQLLLHNAQHMATREEVKEDISKVESSLKEDISKVESSLKEDISKVELNISKVESSLKEDNKNLMLRMDRFIIWSLGLTVTSTFLIIGFIYKLIEKLP